MSKITRREWLVGAGLLVGAAACGRSRSEAPVEQQSSTGPTPTAQPVGFVAHGAPLLALDAEKGAPLGAWGRGMPRPRAILAVSAHWEAAPPALGPTRPVPLIYDFRGFPEALYRVQYAAPVAPELAERVTALLGGPAAVRVMPERGLDHGTWVPLKWMYPEADVPVLQLSLPTEDPAALIALGRRLAPLRAEGVLVLGSGNITHNLRRVDWQNGPPPDWATDFDSWTADVLTRFDLDALAQYRTRAPGVELALPTHEHFTPLLVAAGAASEGAHGVGFPVDGFEYGSLSRRSVRLG